MLVAAVRYCQQVGSERAHTCCRRPAHSSQDILGLNCCIVCLFGGRLQGNGTYPAMQSAVGRGPPAIPPSGTAQWQVIEHGRPAFQSDNMYSQPNFEQFPPASAPGDGPAEQLAVLISKALTADDVVTGRIELPAGVVETAEGSRIFTESRYEFPES